MDNIQAEVREHYAGVVLTPRQFRPAFSVLADVIGSSADHIEQLVAAVGFRPRGFREGGVPVYAMTLDGIDDSIASALMGFRVTVYETEQDNLLLRIDAAVPEAQKSYEAQLAEKLGTTLALDSLQLDLPVQFVPAGVDGLWDFRCNMVPFINALDGFGPCEPRKISAMTGEAAAHEACQDLEELPCNLLEYTPSRHDLRSWAERLMRWRPTLTFMNGLLFVQAQLIGYPPPQPKPVGVGFSDRPVDWPEVRPPFRVEGSTLAAYGEGAPPEKSPVVSVAIRRLNDPHDQPFPLPLVGDAQVQARELAATLAAIRMS